MAAVTVCRDFGALLVQGKWARGLGVLSFKVVLVSFVSAIPLGLITTFVITLTPTCTVQLAKGKEMIEGTCIFHISPAWVWLTFAYSLASTSPCGLVGCKGAWKMRSRETPRCREESVVDTAVWVRDPPLEHWGSASTS